MKFQRKNPDYGVAIISLGNKEIKLDGREVYETEDKREIAVLENDPVLEKISEKKMK